MKDYSLNALLSKGFWREIGRYLGAVKSPAGASARARALDTPAALGGFIAGHASHVAQSALYGYMKTRAGTSFPSLFDTPDILASINIAKWHIYLACLSDLAVYSGVLLSRRTAAPPPRIREIIKAITAAELAQAGRPAEAGPDFAAAAEAVQTRIAAADFAALGDDDSAFSESPAALVYWSPVADELKNRDRVIVRNSMRFKWQEVRRTLRRRLRAEEVLRAAGGG